MRAAPLSTHALAAGRRGSKDDEAAGGPRPRLPAPIRAARPLINVPLNSTALFSLSIHGVSDLSTLDFFFGPEWISQGEATGAAKRPRGGELGGGEPGGERVAPGARALAFTCPNPQCKANGGGAEECRSVKTRRSVTVTQVSVKWLTIGFHIDQGLLS